MNEFRLYWHDRGDRQFIRFIIHRTTLFDGATLLDEDEDARFDRFLFWRIFHKSTLVVDSVSGRPPLLQLIEQQRFVQRELEIHSTRNTAIIGPFSTKRCCATTTRVADAFPAHAAALSAFPKSSLTDSSSSFSARIWARSRLPAAASEEVSCKPI